MTLMAYRVTEEGFGHDEGTTREFWVGQEGDLRHTLSFEREGERIQVRWYTDWPDARDPSDEFHDAEGNLYLSKRGARQIIERLEYELSLDEEQT